MFDSELKTWRSWKYVEEFLFWDICLRFFDRNGDSRLWCGFFFPRISAFILCVMHSGVTPSILISDVTFLNNSSNAFTLLMSGDIRFPVEHDTHRNFRSDFILTSSGQYI